MSNFLRGAQIKFLTVRTPDDSDEKDLTLKLGPIAFYEDILDASIHAEVMILDTAGRLEGVPVRSGSKVFFRIVTPSGVIDFEKEPMFISNIKSSGSTAKREVFVMQLETKGTFHNHFTRCYKKYTGFANTIIKEILTETLQAPEKFEESNLEQPKYPIEFCGNYKRPLQTCVSLATKSVPSISSKDTATRGGSGFFFWEDLEGYNFRSIDKIFEVIQTDKDAIPEYFQSSTVDSLDSKNNYRIVSDPTWKNNNNLLEKLSQGQYMSYNTYFDLNERIHKVAEKSPESVHEYKPENQNEKKEGATNLSNEQPFVPKFFTDKASRIMLSTVDKSLFDNEGGLQTPTYHIEYEARRQSRYAALFSQTLEVTVPLNVGLKAGSVVKMKFPRINIDKPNSGSNNPASGYYMIKSLSHKLLADGDFTALTLIRDAYSELK